MKGINTMKVTRMMMGMAAVVAGLLFSSLAHAGDAPITPSVVPGRWSADKAWQHDLFRPDFSSYDPKEIELFKAAIRENSKQR
jgi:hypothetical protein